MRTLKAGVVYFALVFGAGFVLGTIRTLWVVPSLGARAAELAEAPIMVGIAALAARFVVRRMAAPPEPSVRLALGTVALALMLVAEFTLVLWVRGLSIRDYLASRDPVAETAYYVALLLYAAMPSVVARS
jgi:hypothetical protein